MDQTDVSYYLVAETTPAEDTTEKILKSCEAVDYSGSKSKTFYNGLEGFSDDVDYEFEIKPEKALAKSKKDIHTNFTLLEWQTDELLLEIAELIEEIAEKSNLSADTASLLCGPHEILSLENNSIITSTFSFSFYFEVPLKEEPADLNLRANKDRDLQERISMLEDICKCKFKGFFGGS